MVDKTCSKCGDTKPISNFYRNSHSPDGYRADCKGCLRHNVSELERAKHENVKVYMAQYGIENAHNLRDARLRRNYNISIEQYMEMFKAQGGKCAICRKPSKVYLSVDHDHACCPGRANSCGKCVRGLLCSGCNKSLGNFHDSTEILERAIHYLKGEISW